MPARIHVNRVKRFVASELVRQAIHYHGTHELWRATHIYKEGLTPRELELLEEIRTDMEATFRKLGAISNRLRTTGDDGHGY